jgi:NADH dehydrogenase FAD-containing subunit
MDQLASSRLDAPTPEAEAASRPHVVIVGAGFAGLSAAKALAKAAVDVTVIDRRNYHLFQPLLYQVATAGLSPAEIATPIRAILNRQRNTKVLLGRVTDVDARARWVELGERRISYDMLIVATGARHAYFGHDEWERVAPGLKKIEDATDIRRKILLAFERAETSTDALERRRLLNFVIIGGGPTGVELAGAIVELARKALAADFRNIDPHAARVILVEAHTRVLAGFPETLSAAAKSALERLGVEVRVGKAASVCDEGGIIIVDAADRNKVGGGDLVKEERIEARTILWAAGVAASPAAKWLEAKKDGAGRVKVESDLTLPGHPEIFVIGDTAHALGEGGRPLPGVAPVAKQQGSYVASVIRARLAGRQAPKPFRYRRMGNLATIGRRTAVADFGHLRLSGRLAWFLWGGVHVLFLIGFRNRVAVLLNWLWAYFTFERGSRLITGNIDE